MNPAHVACDATIFVIDDDTTLVDSLLELLGDEGYQGEGFTCPEVALRRLRDGACPKALLLDHMMPGMTGEQFLDALAAARICVPVLLLSGTATPARLRPSVVAALQKPFDVDRLLEAVERILPPPPR